MEKTTTIYTTDETLPIGETAATNDSVSVDMQLPKPVQKADRIQTVDIVRGFALLGILLMNIPIFGIDNSVFHTVLRGPSTATDYRTMAAIYTFFDGTMRGLFSMLFGAGMVLFTMNKKETANGVPVVEYYYRRLLWLVLFGVINAYVFLWEGDILFFYGLLGMLLYPFRNSNPKWLLFVALACFSIGHLKGMLQWNETKERRKGYVEAM
eukprot:gene66127-90485_t